MLLREHCRGEHLEPPHGLYQTHDVELAVKFSLGFIEQIMGTEGSLVAALSQTAGEQAAEDVAEELYGREPESNPAHDGLCNIFQIFRLNAGYFLLELLCQHEFMVLREPSLRWQRLHQGAQCTIQTVFRGCIGMFHRFSELVDFADDLAMEEFFRYVSSQKHPYSEERLL